MSVLLKAKNPLRGFRFFETVAPVKADTPLTTERVWFGDISEVPLGAEKTFMSLSRKANSKI